MKCMTGNTYWAWTDMNTYFFLWLCISFKTQDYSSLKYENFTDAVLIYAFLSTLEEHQAPTVKHLLLILNWVLKKKD